MRDDFEQSMKRKTELDDSVSKKKIEIMSDTDDIDSLNEMEQQIKNPLEDVPEVPESISHSLSQATKESQSSGYNDAIKKLMKKPEKGEGGNEGDL